MLKQHSTSCRSYWKSQRSVPSSYPFAPELNPPPASVALSLPARGPELMALRSHHIHVQILYVHDDTQNTPQQNANTRTAGLYKSKLSSQHQRSLKPQKQHLSCRVLQSYLVPQELDKTLAGLDLHPFAQGSMGPMMSCALLCCT